MTNKSVFNGGQQLYSQLDPGGVIKNVHDKHAQALKVFDTNSTIPGFFSHFSVVYEDNNPTQVSYFRGIAPNKTSVQCLPDVSSSLQNKYFIIYSGFDNQKYHVWYNVDNLGNNPAPSNSIGIEVNINSNDLDIIVAKATEITINSLFSSKFKASVLGSSILIENKSPGVFSSSLDFNTGFNLVFTSGTQETVSFVELSYTSSGDVIFQGQELKGYYYDIYSGKFVKSETSQNLSETLTVRVDEISSTLVYVGEALENSEESDTVWRIQKIETIGKITKVLWANGNSNFTNSWEDRLTLTYG